jgi:hypothetical protein
MEDKEIDRYIEEFKKFKEEVLKTKESAIKFLVDTGINNPDGTLTDKYKDEL